MSSTSVAIVIGAAFAYIFTVRAVRFSRINRVHRDYARQHGLAASPPLERTAGRPPRRSEYPMTPVEAQKIMLTNIELEVPFLGSKALEFALFKTYGIPTISQVLAASRQFMDDSTAGKRYADTGLLIFSWMKYPISGPGSGEEPAFDARRDPRHAVALARMNVLHSHYPTITNDDLLYTLSTFILEGARWAGRFEWRNFTPLEEMAYHVFFSEVGARMGITDIPLEIEDLAAWADAYEADNMIPDPLCRDVGEATVKVMLLNYPSFLKPFGRRVVASLLDDRLREALMITPAHPLLQQGVFTFLKLRGLAIKHLFPPRLASFAVSAVPDPTDAPAFPISSTLPKPSDIKLNSQGEKVFAPLSHPSFWAGEAWYFPEPKGVSSLLQSLQLALGIGNPATVPQAKFKPEGYRIETMGPERWSGKAEELAEVQRRAEEIHGGVLEGPYAVSGMPLSKCPFTL